MKMKKILCCLLVVLSIGTIMPQCVNAEWKNFGQSKYYYDNNGHMVMNQWFYERSTGRYYYLQSDGTMAVGLKQINGDYYYFGNDGGRIIGNININGKSYQTDNTGKILDIGNEEAKEISLSNIKTQYDLDKYLEENYSTLKTPIGTLKFTYKIDENDDDYMPYDFWIQTDYGTIENDKYNIGVFQPYELEHSIKILDSDKKETIELLKDFQKDIAKDAIKAFPNKKIKGGFYTGGYKYQYIRAGYYSIDFLSWTNYEEIDMHDFKTSDYENTEVTSFHWDDDNDDYDFAD